MALLEPKERKRLHKVDSARVHMRLAIAGLIQVGISLACIAWFLQCHPSTVRRWRQRALTSVPSFFDTPRTGRPLIYTEDQQLRTIAFYCQKTHVSSMSDSECKHSHKWSLRWAQKWFKIHPEEGIKAMSRSTIQRILRSHTLKPHAKRYFLHISDPDFFEKMEHIIDVYLNPPEFLFCFDECPGLQVTLPVAPDLEPRPGHAGLREFEYERHGTIDVLAFLRPKTGQVFARCTDNHTTETLIEVFIEHVKSQPPDVPLHYIMDNLNTHFNDGFCQQVATLSNVSYTPLKTGKLRREWLQNTDKRIVIHFTPFHGSWLNLVEVWFSILSQRCLKHCHVHLEQKKAAIANFHDLWNENFAHPFKWKYTGDGLREKVISRLSSFVLSKSDQLQARFLTKQFHLMANLIGDNPAIANTPQWIQLIKNIDNNRSFLESVIERAPKPSQKLRARLAWDRFDDLLNPENPTPPSIEDDPQEPISCQSSTQIF